MGGGVFNFLTQISIFSIAETINTFNILCLSLEFYIPCIFINYEGYYEAKPFCQEVHIMFVKAKQFLWTLSCYYLNSFPFFFFFYTTLIKCLKASNSAVLNVPANLIHKDAQKMRNV